jgi:YHS domain-containing protein
MVGLVMVFGLAFIGSAAAETNSGADSMGGMMNDHAMKHEGMSMENNLGNIPGAVYKAQNTKDGVVLTIAGKDAATVKLIQANTQKLVASKDTNSKPDEMVTCAVFGTKMKKSQAYDSTVYKGKTYYFCCADCKPQFLKNPEKYAK